jgi:hypothetical protein
LGQENRVGAWTINEISINYFTFNSGAKFRRLPLLQPLCTLSTDSLSRILRFCTNRKVISGRGGRNGGNGKEVTESRDI